MSPWARLLVAVAVGLAVACWPTGDATYRRGRRAPRRERRAVTACPAASARGTAAPDVAAADGAVAAGDGAVVVAADVAAACELVSLALGAGAGVDDGVAEVAAVSPPGVRSALHVIVAARRWGLGWVLDDVPGGAPAETPGGVGETGRGISGPGSSASSTVGGSRDLAPWSALIRALRMADAAGIPPAGPLRRAAADLRARRLHRLEVATGRLRVQVVLPLGLCFLPAFVLTTVVPVVLALAARVSAP